MRVIVNPDGRIWTAHPINGPGVTTNSADRLDPTGIRHVREDLGAGEWSEGLDNLLAGLAKVAASITRDEHRELAELLTAINMPATRLNALAIDG